MLSHPSKRRLHLVVAGGLSNLLPSRLASISAPGLTRKTELGSSFLGVPLSGFGVRGTLASQNKVGRFPLFSVLGKFEDRDRSFSRCLVDSPAKASGPRLLLVGGFGHRFGLLAASGSVRISRFLLADPFHWAGQFLSL